MNVRMYHNKEILNRCRIKNHHVPLFVRTLGIPPRRLLARPRLGPPFATRQYPRAASTRKPTEKMISHVDAPSDLLWQLTKKHNAFLRTSAHGHGETRFSTESGNVKNVHSYKHSGAWTRRRERVMDDGDFDGTTGISTDARERSAVVNGGNYK